MIMKSIRNKKVSKYLAFKCIILLLLMSFMLSACHQSIADMDYPDEKLLARQEAIIKSMTRAEREKPDILNASRRKRIAAGSGTTVEDVNKLLKQFDQVNKLMKQFSDPSKLSRFTKGKMKMPF